jgi:hypothetical protein
LGVTSNSDNSISTVSNEVFKNESVYSLISKSLPTATLGILTTFDFPASRRHVEEGNWWQELLERAKPVLKQSNLGLFTDRSIVDSLTGGCTLGDRVCELRDVGRRIAIASSNLEVVGKGLEILPFGKDLGVSEAVREGQREESPKASKESHIELRVDAPTLVFLSG